MKQIVIHLIATIRYRFDYAISQADGNFYELKIGKDVRSPLEILHHMRGLMYYILKVIGGERTPMPEMFDWDEELKLFYESLKAVQSKLEKEEISDEQFLKLTQGPISDALTHIGQIAMISRLNGLPLEKQNFVHARIK